MNWLRAVYGRWIGEDGPTLGVGGLIILGGIIIAAIIAFI